jgi:hypothetical protein
MSGAILVLFQLLLFSITDAFLGTSLLPSIKQHFAGLFFTDSKGVENLLVVALGGLMFAGLFVLGIFVDQLNSLHFAWEMSALQKRLRNNPWVEVLIKRHKSFLALTTEELTSPSPHANPLMLKWWRASPFKIWLFFPAFFSAEQSRHEAEARKRLRACSVFLDFLQSFVLSNKGSSETASHVLGLIERWRMCRTLGTIIAICGIEHVGFVFHYSWKTDPNLEHPMTLILFSIMPLLITAFFALIPVLRSFHRMLDALLPAAYIIIEPKEPSERVEEDD